MLRMFKDAGFRIEKIQGLNSTKNKNYKLVNFFLLENISDAKYCQYVFRVIKNAK